MARTKGPADDRPTTQLAPIEVEALLHEAASAPIDTGAATIEMLPLVAIGDGDPEPPDPSRVARGSDAVTPARVRRTVERLAVADIRGDKKPAG